LNPRSGTQHLMVKPIAPKCRSAINPVARWQVLADSTVPGRAATNHPPVSP
jgi:hypothetical protein